MLSAWVASCIFSPLGFACMGGIAYIVVNGIRLDHARGKGDRMEREVKEYNKRKAYEKMKQEQDPKEIDNVDYESLGMGD